MSEEIGEDFNHNDQGSLSKGSDPDSEEKKFWNNRILFGQNSVNLDHSAFSEFNKKTRNSPVTQKSGTLNRF